LISIQLDMNARPPSADGKNENAAPQGRPLFDRNHTGIMAARSNPTVRAEKIICSHGPFDAALKRRAKLLIGLNQSRPSSASPLFGAPEELGKSSRRRLPGLLRAIQRVV
jgi:hypothetical protein